MSSLRITVERRVIVSSRKFEDVIASIHAAVGHPDMQAFWKEIAAAAISRERRQSCSGRHWSIGPDGVFGTSITASVPQEKPKAPISAPVATPRIVRFRLLGNPLIMMAMARHIHDAGSYAPVTLLVDERDGAVRLSYDTMASFLGSYGEPVALRVARELDASAERLMTLRRSKYGKQIEP